MNQVSITLQTNELATSNLPIGSATGACAGAVLFQGPDDRSAPPPASSQLSPGSSLFSLSSSSFSLQDRRISML